MRMKEMPLSERPYEKLLLYGAEKLSNAELLGIIIKTGTREESAVVIAQKILKLNNGEEGLRFLQNLSIEELMQIKGIGKVKAIQIKAVGELVKRISKPINSKVMKVNNTKDVADLLLDEMRYEKREKVKLIILDNKNKILKILDISLGGTNFALIEPKEVLVEAVKMQAPKIILVHNHPSGDPTPSADDYRVTDRIYECADIMGIHLIDHIVIGDGIFDSVMKRTKDKKYERWKDWE